MELEELHFCTDICLLPSKLQENPSFQFWKLGFFDGLSIHQPSGWMLIHSWAHGHGRESLLLQEEITNDHAFLVPFLFTINAASAAAEWWYTPYP